MPEARQKARRVNPPQGRADKHPRQKIKTNRKNLEIQRLTPLPALRKIECGIKLARLLRSQTVRISAVSFAGISDDFS
jgi:hypothetical protein